MEFRDYLRLLAAKDGTDLYLLPNTTPCATIQGVMTQIHNVTLSTTQIKTIAYELMSKEQITSFELKPEMNLAISKPNVGRFRVNIYKQRKHLAMVVHNIKTELPTAEQLGLPPILTKAVMAKRGLILFVGESGSGKSTSVAALIDHRNSNHSGHILTIEDPIEFLHTNKKAIVSQREVGVDTDSFEDALKNTLRQAPNVIFIGEIRNRETMEHAIAFAETGHLVISTLHANNVNQALDRMINIFPEERRSQLLNDLSFNVRAIISQRLIKSVENKQTAAFEILLSTPRIAELIKSGQIGDIKEVMEKSTDTGMQTLDRALVNLVQQRKITAEQALRNAESQNNVRLQLPQEKAATKPVDTDLSLLEKVEEKKVEKEEEDEDPYNLDGEGLIQ